ncbi:DUF5067 domain-containing protein [Staphylococcus sp. NRL 16/872]|uniref:DUF5067 domain-containing protein n=1 Tax=Staphylococcus sp. NRL 16/872 TaxID=2930131 RepID=UPI001FB2B910|nr:MULTISPECIES: DUF5067 domain-containing protein [unclassified Staphylococcus]MCJ1655212.1 DUF5067 domain-containing protein [Staphylococcus sp. NRL 21/187]MCJ1661046.1 DUF5067 domain-containing protein [Staphylococcus sp. NRL 18/288]MCJ1666944.1 DUF5067 domain-containing protein [Staphylococcus sp. NRL 19/737]WEN69416.1 DUF5067 domain-containing protein [Staphylococcus sp. NRL 16/872]
MKKLLAFLFASTLILGACSFGDMSGKSSDSDTAKKSSESKKEDSSNSSSSDSEDSNDTDSVDVDSSSDNEKKSESKFENDTLTSKDFDIKIEKTEIVEASKYAEDDNPNLAIVYSVTNKNDKKELTANSAFFSSFDAYQDSKNVKRSLKSGDGYDSELDRKYGENDTDEINKGGTVKAVKFYKLKDTKTPVTIQVKDPDDYSNDHLAKKEIELK